MAVPVQQIVTSTAQQPVTQYPVTTQSTTQPYKPYVTPVPMQRTSKVREVVRGDGTMNNLLFDLISIASPHKSEGEAKVRELIAKHLTGLKVAHYTDKMGNLIAQVGRVGQEGGSRTMFSCHMDTVHSKYDVVTPVITEGSHADAGWIYGAKKSVTTTFHNSLTDKTIQPSELQDLYKSMGVDDLDPRLVKVGTTKDGKDVFRVTRNEPTNKGARVTETTPVLTKTVHGPVFTEKVLGADDKVGCYILCRLIQAKVPGLYVFHVGEEVSGVGSKWLVKNTPQVVAGIHRCVAFDRANYQDVIIDQAGGACASREFGNALADALNQFMPPFNTYAASTHGVYTDSAEYTRLIPECTNLSVGYVGQHGTGERFDLHFLEDMLVPAAIKLDWESLPTVRKCVPKQSRSWYGYGNWDDDAWSDLDPNRSFDEAYDRVKKGGTGFPTGGVTDDERSAAEDKKIIAELDKVPPAMVTSKTPLDRMPTWEPEDGLLPNTSKESMIMLIATWILTNHMTAREIAAEFYDMMVDLDVAAEQLDNYDRSEFFDR